MDTNIHNNSLNGGGGINNVIIRIPSKNEHNSILLNSNLNGTIDITTSKLNVWNFKYDGTGFDFSMLQYNYIDNFTNPSRYWNGNRYVQTYYYVMDKSNKSIIKPSHGNEITLPCFRPIFKFDQE